MPGVDTHHKSDEALDVVFFPACKGEHIVQQVDFEEIEALPHEPCMMKGTWTVHLEVLEDLILANPYRLKYNPAPLNHPLYDPVLPVLYLIKANC